MNAAYGPQLARDILGGRVQRALGTQRAGELQFIFADVNRQDFTPHVFRQLNGQVPQPAHTKHGYALTRANPRKLRGAIDGDPGTKQRGGFFWPECARDPGHVADFSSAEFGVATVNRAAGDSLTWTKVFVSLSAELALSASPMDPRDTYSFADGEIAHPLSSLRYTTHDLVSKDDRGLHLDHIQ
jgi:hypothetical protein